MKKTAFIVSLVVLCAVSVNAGAAMFPDKWNVKLKYGIEWGYTATFFEHYHSNFFDPDVGYRIDNIEDKVYLYSNANVAARIGVNMFNHYSLTMLAGYAGVKQDRRTFPLTFRATYFPISYEQDGWMFFGEGGMGLPLNTKKINDIYSDDVSYFGKAGAGYRMKLSKKSSLDFNAYLQLVAKDHPYIYNMDKSEPVPDVFVRRSDGFYGSLNLSIALEF